jgi:hypothetical protein
VLRDLRIMAVAVGLLTAAVLTGCAEPKHDSPAATYNVTMTTIEGTKPDHTGHWRAQVAQLSVGDPAVAEAFNNASQAAARQQIDDVRAGDTRGIAWRFDSDSEVTFRNPTIAVVITGDAWGEGDSHPGSYASTVVIDTRTARPITLGEMFTNQQDGLNRLAEQLRIIEPRMPDQPGVEPRAENFANWIPTEKGMEFHFADYQFGYHGLPVYTVPWSALADLLTPNMRALAQG